MDSSFLMNMNGESFTLSGEPIFNGAIMTKRTTQEAVEDVLKMTEPKEKKVKNHPEGVSSGSTLMNLACTGRADIAFISGKSHMLVGDSSSGKTALSLTCFAEAANNPAFDGYRLIYDPTEHGNLFPVEELFGRKAASRIESVCGYDEFENPLGSRTGEEFYINLYKCCVKGVPFIYVLDSQDGLSSNAETDKFNENMGLFDRGNQMKGSYGDGKAKLHSANLRKIIPMLEEMGSILILINQTRDDPVNGWKTYSGGKSLKFYATLEIWSSVKKKLTKTIGGIDYENGIEARIQVKKNRVTGLLRDVIVPIYPSTGLDDVGSCVQYLISTGHWTKGTKIKAEELGLECSPDSLVKKIDEDPELYKKLVDLVQAVWDSFEERVKVVRRKRYE